MFHSVRAALELVYSTSDVYAGFSYVAVAGAVFAAGSIFCFLLFYFLEYVMLSNQRRRQAVKILANSSGKSRLWAWRPWQLRSNFVYFCLKVAFVSVMGVVVWVAGGASGFNPWTAGATMMVIGILITYTLAVPLGLWGAGFGVTGTNMINVGEYWEFYGMKDYDAWITGIFTLEVEMMRVNEQGATEIISMPMTQFLQAPRKRNIDKELQTKDLPWRLAGDTHFREWVSPTNYSGLHKKVDMDEGKPQSPVRSLYFSPELIV
jgi:hypothetical protein